MTDFITSELATINISGKIITINGAWGWKAFGIKYVDGTVTIQGTTTIIADDGTVLDSSPQPIDSSNFEATGENGFDNVVIDATTGHAFLNIVI